MPAPRVARAPVTARPRTRLSRYAPPRETRPAGRDRLNATRPDSHVRTAVPEADPARATPAVGGSTHHRAKSRPRTGPPDRGPGSAGTRHHANPTRLNADPAGSRHGHRRAASQTPHGTTPAVGRSTHRRAKSRPRTGPPDRGPGSAGAPPRQDPTHRTRPPERVPSRQPTRAPPCREPTRTGPRDRGPGSVGGRAAGHCVNSDPARRCASLQGPSPPPGPPPRLADLGLISFHIGQFTEISPRSARAEQGGAARRAAAWRVGAR